MKIKYLSISLTNTPPKEEFAIRKYVDRHIYGKHRGCMPNPKIKEFPETLQFTKSAEKESVLFSAGFVVDVV